MLATLGSIGSFLSSAGQAAGGLSALGGLFGGGEGASANDLARSQMHFNLMGMQHAPYATVVGLRRAGLNPMLAIGKATPAPSIGMPNPVDDRQVATARSLAAASVANQAAQADLYSAQAAKVRAETPGNDLYIESVAASAAKARQDARTSEVMAGAQSALANLHHSMAQNQDQLSKTEGWKTKLAELEFSLNAEQYPNKIAELRTRVKILMEELKTAERLGKLNESQFAEYMGYLKMFSDALPGLNIRGSNTYNSSTTVKVPPPPVGR